MTEALWSGRGVVRGEASGPAMHSATALSFLGDVDIRSGAVVGRSSDLAGRIVTGAVLILPATRGSAGAWRFLYQLKLHGTHPAALVVAEMPDPSVVQGAILSGIPIVVAAPQGITDGTILRVDGTAGTVRAAVPDQRPTA